jgi:hypothetical protein
MTTNPRQRRLRKFWQSDPKPGPGNMPPPGVTVREATDEEQRAALDRAAADYLADMETAEPPKETKP